MKMQWGLILLGAAFFAGCASISRNPSSETRFLGDQYGDAIVVFCGEDSAVVSIDPNRCGEAMANGSPGCTELAGYTSPRLKVVKRGKNLELVDDSKKVIHELSASRSGYTLQRGWGLEDAVQLRFKPVEAKSQAAYLMEDYCR